MATYASVLPDPQPAPLGRPAYHLQGGVATLVTSGADDPAAGVRVGALALPPACPPSTCPRRRACTASP